jgi:nitrogenase subunit NifH
MVESSSKQVAASAVELLHKSALVSEVPKTQIARRVGTRRQTVAKRFEKGDMKMTDYLKTAEAVGADPVEVLQQAIQKHQPRRKK